MTSIRIDQPLYRRRSREWGFATSPTTPEEANQEVIERQHWELPWLSKRTRYLGHSFDGWVQQPLSDAGPTQEETINKCIFDVPVRTRDENTYLGFQIAPLAADNSLASALTHFDLPPLGENITPFDGLQIAPLSADLVVGALQATPYFPDFLFPKYDPRNIDFFLGLQAGPLSPNAPVVGAPTIFIPTYRPRRR